MRVEEAWQEGMDALAITDHIEYRPFKKVVIGDLNESFKLAKKQADGMVPSWMPASLTARVKSCPHTINFR